MAFNRFGSISHGTLRIEDLFPAFFSEFADRFSSYDATLKDTFFVYAERAATYREIKEIVDAIETIGEDNVSEAFWVSEWAVGTLCELQELLGEDLPPFVHFGAHPGDGSDFGYWFSHDAFETSVQDGEVLKVSDLGELDMVSPDDLAVYEYVAVISDHGNITLYASSDLENELYGIV